MRNGVTPCRAHGRMQGGSGRLVRHAHGVAEGTRLNGAARVSRCQPDTARWGDSPRSQRRWERQRICRRGDGDMHVIGMSRAAEAVSTPVSDVGMTREGEAPKCRSQARKGAHDRGRITEEPCEVETLMHGSAAETGGAIPSPTVTGRGGQRSCAARWFRRRSVVVSPPPLSAGVSCDTRSLS
jgi:hypothetical protein